MPPKSQPRPRMLHVCKPQLIAHLVPSHKARLRCLYQKFNQVAQFTSGLLGKPFASRPFRKSARCRLQRVPKTKPPQKFKSPPREAAVVRIWLSRFLRSSTSCRIRSCFGPQFAHSIHHPNHTKHPELAVTGPKSTAFLPVTACLHPRMLKNLSRALAVRWTRG